MATSIASVMNLNSAPATTGVPGNDPMDFVRDNRIHIKHGSLFIDPYLAIHPRELDPKNEAQLRKKLELTYSINNPSFYEAPERVAVALNLGQLVPASLDAKRSKLVDEVKKFNSQVDTGPDPELKQQADDKRNPFGAVVRETMENPNVDPVGIELLKNGMAMYLLMREKLTMQGYREKLTDYVERSNTPDQVLDDLKEKIGVTPQQVREAALQDGVDGVGKLLGLDPAYVASVKNLAEYASTQDFGYNLVEHWHIGRQQLGINAPLIEKLTQGMQTRITHKIAEYRARVKHAYDVAVPVQAEERRIAEALERVEPIQRELMHALGYEICFTPEATADEIAFHKGVYGLHRKAANTLSDIRATYRIFFSGKGDVKGSMRTLCHEIAHNLWPDHFTRDDVVAIDRLASADQQRFATLQRMMDSEFDTFAKLVNAYNAGGDAEKKAVLAAANATFRQYGLPMEGLLPYLKDPFMFKDLVAHAHETLQIEGERYNRSGYDTPQERFREVLSRFAEIKQVELRGEPQLLQFLAPGLNQIWENHYIPHLKRVYQDVLKHKAAEAPSANGAPAQSSTPTEQVPVEQQPKVEERPKVEDRPLAISNSTVSASKTAHSLDEKFLQNPNTQAAFSALKSMHIHQSMS